MTSDFANKFEAGKSIDSSAYEWLVQSIVDYAVYILSLDGRVVTWNAGAERIKGYLAEEIIGEHFSRFYTPEDVEKGVPVNALKLAREAGRFSAEGWRLRKDGSRFWASVVIDPIRQDGSIVGFAKITRDITENRDAANAALAAERRFRILVQGVTDYAIFMLSPDGVVTNWNTGAQRIKGYAEAEIVGQHFSRFYTAEDRAEKLPWLALETARRDGRYHAEGWRQRKDGDRFWASVVIDAIFEDDGSLLGFAKITRDLTERREAEMELARSREQLFQSQKMEAVGQLTGGLAHDFNNLLAGITGTFELIRTRIAQGRISELERYVAAGLSAATRAAALTHRLLAFSRRQTLQPVPLNADNLIAGIEDLVRRTVGPAITVEAVATVGLWSCLCDANQLENAILNLCINARDAMPDGGRLTIETANAWADDAGARMRDMPPGQYVAVCVTDTGTGMAQDVVARAFDPFFTTKPIGMGTGLGLSMIYGFAQQSGGQVQIYSEVGEGTTVKIYLPRYLGKEKVEIASPQSQEMPRSEHGEIVLVVDDEPTIRMLISDTLAELGYRSIEVGDAASGLKVLQSDARVDLLISDVGLPGGMNGRQMVDAARISRPDLKVLFITGYADNAAIGNGNLEPGMHVLTKPFVMENLAARIKAVLDADR